MKNSNFSHSFGLGGTVRGTLTFALLLRFLFAGTLVIIGKIASSADGFVGFFTTYQLNLHRIDSSACKRRFLTTLDANSRQFGDLLAERY